MPFVRAKVYNISQLIYIYTEKRQLYGNTTEYARQKEINEIAEREQICTQSTAKYSEKKKKVRTDPLTYKNNVNIWLEYITGNVPIKNEGNFILTTCGEKWIRAKMCALGFGISDQFFSFLSIARIPWPWIPIKFAEKRILSTLRVISKPFSLFFFF